MAAVPILTIGGFFKTLQVEWLGIIAICGALVAGWSGHVFYYQYFQSEDPRIYQLETEVRLLRVAFCEHTTHETREVRVMCETIRQLREEWRQEGRRRG